MIPCSSAPLGSLITSDFDEPVLYDPIRVKYKNPCTNLKIITAFIDIDRIQTHVIEIIEGINRGEFKRNISIEILLGMTKTSLSAKKHEDICRVLFFINNQNNGVSLSCRYLVTNKEIHSKIYIWGDHNTPQTSFCGSLNYTMNAFKKRRESVCVANPKEALEYYYSLIDDTVDCRDSSVQSLLKNINAPIERNEDDPLDSSTEYDVYNKKTSLDTLKVSLLIASGSRTGNRSGVNWGNRPGRDPNEAYIPYNKQDKKEGFFPEKNNANDRNYPRFRVITKDFGAFHMRLAQANAKALESVESNAILGVWLRKKLGLKDGEYITKQMLELYGKTYVTFRKYSDGVYLLDF